ncbi:hypothetical protein BY996DRAFT_6513072 [Phakopsora pachyrhizi]|nr:hypothetical protein BY996DRAFT_6513072 [Phakopsora pachyrhizi]
MMIIPTGWIHVVYMPTNLLVFGGNYLHSLNIPTQLRIHHIKNNTKVLKKFRFLIFSLSLWLVENHYFNWLKQRTMENDKKQDLDNQTQGHKDFDNVEVIPDWILSRLLTLSRFFINQSEGVGTDVKDFTNGKKDLGEIIFRSNEAPSTKIDIQHLKVPNYEADWEKKENEEVRANGKEEDDHQSSK